LATKNIYSLGGLWQIKHSAPNGKGMSCAWLQSMFNFASPRFVLSAFLPGRSQKNGLLINLHHLTSTITGSQR
jgi:hypothetical protein